MVKRVCPSIPFIPVGRRKKVSHFRYMQRMLGTCRRPFNRLVLRAPFGHPQLLSCSRSPHIFWHLFSSLYGNSKAALPLVFIVFLHLSHLKFLVFAFQEHCFHSKIIWLHGFHFEVKVTAKDSGYSFCSSGKNFKTLPWVPEATRLLNPAGHWPAKRV